MENGILRICVGTSDLARSAAFFTRELELTEVCRGTLAPEHVRGLYGLDCSADYLMLRNDEQPTLLQLIQFNGVPGRPIRAGRPSWDFGYYDVAFRAKDNSAAYDRFTAQGRRYYCPPTRYVADWINLDVLEGVLCGPDELPLALIERLKEPIPKFAGQFSIFTDVAQTVENAEEATRFYVNVLGLTPVFDERLPDGLVNAIVGVPAGTHTRMLMYAGANTPITECLEYSRKGVPMADVAVPGNYGVFSTAYARDDLDAVLRRAKENGFAVTAGPVEVPLAPYGRVRAAHISGPSRMTVEVFQTLL